MIKNQTSVAEAVGKGHPDKQADAMSDAVLDVKMDRAVAAGHPPSSVRVACEVMINGADIIVGGEISAPEGVYDAEAVEAAVREVYFTSGNDPRDDLRVTNLIRPQAGEIAALTVDGAGDQGIMEGYATTRTRSMLPPETEKAWALIRRAYDLATDGTLPWLRLDTKSQVALDPSGEVISVIMSVQHRASVGLEELRREVLDRVVRPCLGDVAPGLVKINHKGSFIEGGADADCGLTGRKIVVDAYGPSVAVGGGAYSGKDATKVDRSAAYMARFIARQVLASHPGGGTDCTVKLAYGIGQLQPEAVSAIIDGKHDVSDWVRARFADLSPRAIQDRLGLWRREGWRYRDTASFGHYGRDLFPWEQAE